jgi:FMN phosphatase YigB (HAD superfamily)
LIRGLMFDLDNTLLSIDVDEFVERYTRAAAARLVPEDPERGWAVVTGASYRMLTDRAARESNRDRLLASLSAELGVDPLVLWPRLESVASEVLPALRTLATPIAGARETVLEARRRGLRIALATNPIYPRAVIVERMRWAGLSADDVDFVACLESCASTKPHAAYFTELAAALGLAVDECLMIGDDPDQDVPDAPSPLRVHLLATDADSDGAEGGTRARGLVRHGPLAALWRLWEDELKPYPTAATGTEGE